jgi:hypothetical protein
LPAATGKYNLMEFNERRRREDLTRVYTYFSGKHG